MTIHINQELQERMLSFVSNYLRVQNSKEPSCINDEEHLMEMEANAIIAKIDSSR